jgi:hypothetical protein
MALTYVVYGFSRTWRSLMNAKVECKLFSSSTRHWNDLVAEATAFATSVGRERLINISVSASGGTDLFGFGGQGAIFVWYWDK